MMKSQMFPLDETPTLLLPPQLHLTEYFKASASFYCAGMPTEAALLCVVWTSACFLSLAIAGVDINPSIPWPLRPDALHDNPNRVRTRLASTRHTQTGHIPPLRQRRPIKHWAWGKEARPQPRHPRITCTTRSDADGDDDEEQELDYENGGCPGIQHVRR